MSKYGDLINNGPAVLCFVHKTGPFQHLRTLDISTGLGGLARTIEIGINQNLDFCEALGLSVVSATYILYLSGRPWIRFSEVDSVDEIVKTCRIEINEYLADCQLDEERSRE